MPLHVVPPVLASPALAMRATAFATHALPARTARRARAPCACAEPSQNEQRAAERRIRLSLPTPYERRWLLEGGVRRGRNRGYVRTQSFEVRIKELIRAPHPRYGGESEVPIWAYIAHVRATKNELGKKAVVRNRAKRRLKAACAQVLPVHALRGCEYNFSALPEILVVPFDALKEEVVGALRKACVYVDVIPYAMARRRRFPDTTAVVVGEMDKLKGGEEGGVDGGNATVVQDEGFIEASTLDEEKAEDGCGKSSELSFTRHRAEGVML